MEPHFEVLPPQRPLPPTRRPGCGGGLVGVLVVIGSLLFKFAAPLLILLKTGGTMLLSVAAYCFAFGWSWQLATGLVVLIFVHEMGHFISARAYGIEVSAPMFIPLMGAYVMLKERPLDPWKNYVISFAGPLAGGLGGWGAYFLGQQLGYPWLFAVAFYTFALNLFNLLPIPGLDGSHVWAAFFREQTPTMAPGDRVYSAIFLIALGAALVLGGMETFHYISAR